MCVDRVSWALVRNGEAFMRAELQGFAFHTARDRDHTGTTKVALHDLLLRDNTALVGAAPNMPPGTVLASWKPDESWIDEEMLRM